MSPSRGRRTHSSSPKRKPLHERSPSQNNARSLSSRSRPSIRIVEDDAWISQSRVYGKNPFPNRSSQILLPGSAHGWSRPSSVSDRRLSSSASTTTSFNESLVPRPLQPLKAARASGSTNFSEGDTLIDTSLTSFKRFSQRSTTPTTPTFAEGEILEEKLGAVIEEKDAKEHRYSTIRPIISSSPASSDRASSSLDENVTRLAPSSGSSSDSVRTLTPYKRDDGDDTSSTNYEVIASSPPHPVDPSSYRGLQEASTAKKLPKPIFPPAENASAQSLSDLSFISSYISIDEPLQSSSPSPNPQDDIRSAIASGSPVQQPTLRPRSTSASYVSELEAEDLSNLSTLSASPHMLDAPGREHWTPRLSPAHLDSEPSTSQSRTADLSSRNRQATTATIGSIATSAEHAPLYPTSDVSIAKPAPLFQRNGRSFTPDSQELQESDDTVPELYSPPLRTVRSNRSFFSVFSNAESRPSSASGSVFERGSFMESNFFPAWARSYYRRDSSSLPSSDSTTTLSLPIVYMPTPTGSRINTAIPPPTPSGPSRTPSLDYVPATLHHPRKRPRQPQHPRGQRPPTSESVVSFVEPEIERPLPAIPVLPPPATVNDPPRQPKGPRPQPRGGPQRPVSTRASHRSGIRNTLRHSSSGRFTWTPRLAHDRRSAGVLSAMPAPSLASSLGSFSKLFGEPGHRQIALFVVGFAIPFAWMLAAFLPLPAKPADDDVEGGVAAQHRREQEWRQARMSQLSQLGGMTMVIDPEGRSEVVVHGNGTETRHSVSAAELGRTLDSSTQPMEPPQAARENSAVQMQSAFMHSWFGGELEKLELRRRYAKAQWWRRLNRIMSIIGLLVLGAVVSLPSRKNLLSEMLTGPHRLPSSLLRSSFTYDRYPHTSPYLSRFILSPYCYLMSQYAEML